MKQETRYAIFTGLLALAMRFGHLVMLGHDPIADVIMLDSWSYDRLARLILQGSFPQKVYFQAPLYPWILATVYRLTDANLDAVRIVQMLLDALAAICVFRITLLLISRRAALLAGIGFAVYPVLIFESGLILKTTLNVFFAAVMIWLVVETKVMSPGFRLLALGLASGWAAATQGSVLLQIPLILLWIIVNSGWNRPRIWSGRLGCFALGLVLSIGPFTIRNYRVSGRFVLLTSQGGANFYLGNSPYSDGTSRRPPHVRMTPEYEEEDFHREAERLSGRRLTPEEASRFWRDEAIRWMKANPGDALRLQLRKLGLFWNRVEIPDNYDFDFYRRYSAFIRFPRYPFWITGSLGILGMLILCGTWRRTWFLYIWAISYCLIWVMFHIYSRYRLPMVVFLLPFAAGAIDNVLKSLQNRSLGKLAGSTAIMAGVLYLQALPLTAYSHAQPLFNRGVGLTRLGNPAEARKSYLEALKILPDYEPAMVNLGKLAWAQGNRTEAIAWWQKALAINPKAVEAHSNLGSYLAMEGRMADAREHFLVATQEQPYYFLGWLHLAQAEQSLGQPGRALEAFDRALELEPQNVQALYGRAKALDALGRSNEAIDAWNTYIGAAEGLSEEMEFLMEARRRIALITAYRPGPAENARAPFRVMSPEEAADQGRTAEHPAQGVH